MQKSNFYHEKLIKIESYCAVATSSSGQLVDAAGTFKVWFHCIPSYKFIYLFLFLRGLNCLGEFTFCSILF